MTTIVGPNNCPIRERTADGRVVGRCWFHCPDGVCPRHGDVRYALERLPMLTDEREHVERQQPETWEEKES
jgi:hypothetical protein